MGNITDDFRPWPVQRVARDGGGWRIVVPYTLVPPTEQEYEIFKELVGLVETIPQSRRENAKAKAMEASLYAAEKRLAVIKEAIANWNATNLVYLMDHDEYSKDFGKPKNWVQFETTKADGCIAQCIGVCPAEGVQVISCDLEGEFIQEPVLSMMHEIGHIVGLRHEFARSDRDEYVSTTFRERGGIPVGPYDFFSIMHYAIGVYGEKRDGYLHFADAVVTNLTSKYTRAQVANLLSGWKAKIGHLPVLSGGDIAAVTQLYSGEFKKAMDAEQAEQANEVKLRRMGFGAASLPSPAAAAARRPQQQNLGAMRGGYPAYQHPSPSPLAYNSYTYPAYQHPSPSPLAYNSYTQDYLQPMATRRGHTSHPSTHARNQDLSAPTLVPNPFRSVPSHRRSADDDDDDPFAAHLQYVRDQPNENDGAQPRRSSRLAK